MGIARAIVKGFANIGFHILYKVDLKGIENIPETGGAVLCSNHIHALDSVLYVTRASCLKQLFITNVFKSFFSR